VLLRLFTFRVASPAESTDTFLRERVQPGVLSRGGLEYAYFGRGVDREGEIRLVATVWSDVANANDELKSLLEFERDAAASEPTVDLYDCILAKTYEDKGVPQIIRVYRADLRPAEMQPFLDDSRIVLDRSAPQMGASAIFLGALDPDTIVALSTWSNWDQIAAATGGDISDPIRTRQTKRLLTMSATHYEVVPSTVVGSATG
jgi:hypothetical protein